MHAYLIDPEKKSIEEVDYEGSLDDLYRIIGCTHAELLRIGTTKDAVYVDAEARILKLHDSSKFVWRLRGTGILIGRGLVISPTCTNEGAPTLSLEELHTYVSFPEGDNRWAPPPEVIE